MTNTKDGGPAFGHGTHKDGGDPGMSLRDYFAGQALVAFRCNEGVMIESLAENAYLVADAMLKAREK